MAYYDGSIRINTKLNTQGFTTGVQRMTASLGRLAAAVGIAFSVGALVKMGQQAIDLASDIQEVDNVVSKSFGNMRGEMDALANTAIEKLGMSRLTAYQTGSTFMSMGKSMLTSAEDAKDMALALTELTGNMSSFYNVTQDVASTALKSIYTGETETMKQFGVVMTEANLQQFAYEQGIKKTISAMTQSEKVMLRYKYVAEQLSFIGSDFADTQNSWANQTRILSEQWKELLSILGSGLISVLTPVVKGLNGILSSLISIANAAGKIISDVFGIETQQLSINAGSVEDAADAMVDYGNATEEAAKKAKNATAAFDDLNVLQQEQSSTSTGGVSGGFTSTGVVQETESFSTQVNGKLTQFMERVKAVLEEVKAIFDSFGSGDFLTAGEGVSNLVTGIFKWFSKAIKKVDWKKIGNNIGDFLKGINWVEVLSSLADTLWEAVKGAADVWFGMFEEAPFETALISTIALWTFTGFGKSMGELIASAIPSSITKNIGLTLVAVTIAWEWGLEKGKEIGKDLSKDKELYDNFKFFGEGGFFDEIFNTDAGILWDAFVTMLSDFSAWMDKKGEELGEWFKSVGTNIWNTLLGWGTEFWNWWDASIGGWWESVTSWFTLEKWLGLLGNIKKAFSTKWDEVKTWWEDTALGKWWTDSVEPWFSKDKWEEGMGGIKDAFSSVFKNACNLAIDIFNKLIEWINERMHFTWDAISIAGMQIAPAGDVQLFTLSQIPKLAQGAVFRGGNPYLAVVNDQPSGQTNIEAPLETIKQGLREELAQSGAGGGTYTFVIELDGKQLARAQIPYLEKESARTGTNFRVRRV